MFSSLDRIDMLLAHANGTRCLQTDHRPSTEIQRQEELSILFALTRVLGPLRLGAADEVVYVCAEPPPDFLLRAVAWAGGTLQLQKGPVLPYEGLRGPPDELADDAFRRLAQRVLRERNATLDEGALVALQQELTPVPDKEKDEPVYWTRVAELAAVAGELLRAKFGGQWVAAPRAATIPFAFRFAIAGSSRYILNDVADKAARFLESGARESPLELLHGGQELDSQGPGRTPVPIRLRDAQWPRRDMMACRPLVPWQDPRVALPWLTYGEELPNMFGHFARDSLLASELDALHAQALGSLKAVELEVLELSHESSRMLAVIGHLYATEKVLDVDFLRGLHQRLGSSSLVAGIPRRGLLFVMDARMKPTSLKGFAGLCAAQYQRGDSEPICSTPLLIEDGKISGFVWEHPNGSARLVRASELNKEPSRGFFSWLVSWKKR